MIGAMDAVLLSPLLGCFLALPRNLKVHTSNFLQYAYILHLVSSVLEGNQENTAS